MVHVILTEEEKIKLIDETNAMIKECDELSMDLMCLHERMKYFSPLDFLNKKKKNSDVYEMLEKRIQIKNRRLLSLKNKIETNKEILGILPSKKKFRFINRKK